MKKILFLLAAVGAFAIGAMLPTVDVKAQCNGVFPANTVCGNNTAGPAPPAAVPATAITAGGTVNWLNVKSTCGAKGDGTTDDTAAINTCIANFNTAGNGVLYFPAGTYKTTTGLTPLTGNGTVTGDGQTNLSGQIGTTAIAATLIQSATTAISTFVVNSQNLMFSNLSLQNVGSTTPIAGSAGITVTSSSQCQKVDYSDISVASFYIDIDVKVGCFWTMQNANIIDAVQYGVRVNNTVNSDAGAWNISDSFFFPVKRTATTEIRIEGSGAGKINNIEIVGGAAAGGTVVNGIDVIANSTVDLVITGGSIENFTGTGININGSWPGIFIMGVEFGLFTGTPAHIITASNTSNLIISDIVIHGGTPSGVPINLSSCTNCYVNGVVGTVTNPFVGGSFPDHDSSGGIGGNNYFATVGGVASTLNWTGTLSSGMTFEMTLPSAASANAVGMEVINDVGTHAQLQSIGSTNATVANIALLSSNKTIQILADDQVLSGGSDDVQLRPGGFNQLALVASHSGGHISFPGTAFSAPTIAGGCGGTSSIVAGSDAAANVTGQNSNVTSCILQFGTAYSAAPVCTASGISSPLTGTITASTTSLTVHFTGTTSYQWSYICHGT